MTSVTNQGVRWRNPYQSREERDRRIQELLDVETDPEVRKLLEIILTDDRGVIHVKEDGTLQHLEWKIRES